MTIALAAVLAFTVSFKYLWKLLSNLIRPLWPPDLPEWHVVDTIDVILIVVFGLTALVCRFPTDTDVLFNCTEKGQGSFNRHAVWHVTERVAGIGGL